MNRSGLRESVAKLLALQYAYWPVWLWLMAAGAVLTVTRPELGMPLLLAGCVLLAVDRLKTGVFLWMVLAGTLLVPLYTTRNSAVYPSTAYLSALLAIWATGMMRRRQVDLAASRLTVPLLTLAVVAVVSGVQGRLFYDSDVVGVHRFALVETYAVALVVLSVSTALLVAKHVDSVETLRWVYRIVVALAALMLLSTVPGIAFGRQPLWKPIIMAHGVGVVYAALLCDASQALWKKALSAAFVLCAVVQIVLVSFLYPRGGQWVSGWLMLSVPIVFITAVRFPRTFMVLTPPVAALFTYLGLPLLRQAYDVAYYEGDFGRFYIWRDALRVLVLRPILGVGPGNYMDYAARYAQWHIPFASAHGNYQQVAAEMGLVGLASLLWVLVGVFVVGGRLFRRLQTPFLRGFVLGVMGSLSGQMAAAVLGDYIVPAYHNGGYTTICTTLYTWMMIGAVMAMESFPTTDKSKSS